MGKGQKLYQNFQNIINIRKIIFNTDNIMKKSFDVLLFKYLLCDFASHKSALRGETQPL